MKTVEKTIGVMDPNAFAFRESVEKLIESLAPSIEYNGVVNKVSTRRIKCRPYDVLNAKTTCHAIINRGAHWNPHHNSFFQRVSHQTYLLNDMGSFFAINKNTSYGHMSELGLKIPNTFALPQEDNTELENSTKVSPDLIFPEYEMFNLEEIGEAVGYPAFLKPQDGGGWVGVEKVDNYEELLVAYKKSGEKPQNLQKAVDNYKEFIRCVGMGPDVIPMHYNAASEFSHDRYFRSDDEIVDPNFLDKDSAKEVKQICKVINAFYGWDHNSCETLMTENGDIHPIDFANAYPDSSLVSLHYYFPDLVKNCVKWMLFVVCSERKKKIFGHDWDAYYKLKAKADKENWTYKKLLDGYEKLADKHYATKDFNKFVKNNLGKDFDKKCHEFFASEEFGGILAHEVERYFKIPAERPAKIQKYKEIHQIWLDDNKVG
ncbi:MAG: hypothetical protein KC646_05790 [Candidatus Cloacimonetes bacterium]|nr:hypothetical protein [Candidatus Cloacimonadota bacterium]